MIFLCSKFLFKQIVTDWEQIPSDQHIDASASCGGGPPEMLSIANFVLGRSSRVLNVGFGLSGAESGEKEAMTKWQSNYLERGSWRRVVRFL